MHRLLARPAAAVAGVLIAHRVNHSVATTEGSKPAERSQAVAASYAQRLSTSDGTPYTLEYLNRSKRFTVWRGDGTRSTFSEMLSAAAEHDIVLLGEEHHDAVTHKLQEILFARLAACRPVTLSLEMFETDVQHVVDEYLGGLARERDLLNDARPWGNYNTGYRPLVELAKAAGLPVVAANAPRRYVSAVGREGADVLTRGQPWSTRLRADLPPLPLPPPSAAYLERLRRDPEVSRPAELTPIHESSGSASAASAECPFIGLRREDGLLAPMLLWDATMAHAVAGALAAAESDDAPSRPMAVHVCGRDHCLGIIEMLGRHYRPSASRPLIIAFYPEAGLEACAPHHLGVGDFVVLTDDACNS